MVNQPSILKLVLAECIYYLNVALQFDFQPINCGIKQWQIVKKNALVQ